MGWKIAQSFVFYFDFQPLHRSNIATIMRGDFEEKYLHQLQDFDAQEFLPKTYPLEDFLYDINRQNAHLILKKNTFLNEQRRFLRFREDELCMMIHNYKQLFVQQMLKMMKKKKAKDREKQLAMERHVETEAAAKKEVIKYPTFIDWDRNDFRAYVQKELERTANAMAIIVFERGVKNTVKEIKRRLFNICAFGKPLPRPYFG